MLLPNCLFRVGGAAMLLSNRRRDAWRAKYDLLHTVSDGWGMVAAACRARSSAAALHRPMGRPQWQRR